MHPSQKIFQHIRAIGGQSLIGECPAYFALASDGWRQLPISDMESFHRHIHQCRPKATLLLTSYTVGEKRMLVGHYESASQACHQVWSIGPDGALADVYQSPIHAIGARQAA